MCLFRSPVKPAFFTCDLFTCSAGDPLRASKKRAVDPLGVHPSYKSQKSLGVHEILVHKIWFYPPPPPKRAQNEEKLYKSEENPQN